VAPTRTSSTVGLTWTASTDDVGVERYEVSVDGAPVGTTTGTSFTVTGLAPSSVHTVTVEAIDAGGNRSGRTAGLGVTTAIAPGAPVVLVPRGDTWRYRDAGAAPGATWTTTAFDDSTWLTGRAEIGREGGDEVTLLGSAVGTRWFRRTFTVTGAASLGPLEIEVLADDGAVLHLNGVEVARDNMPAGPITPTTAAADYRVGQGQTQRHTFTVPASALHEGVNVLAIEVHQAAGSTDVSFDARLRST
jgi:chitodextrinase